MSRIFKILVIVFFMVPNLLFAQSVLVSDFDREDTRDMNFEIIGKMNSNILVYKNIRSKHKISIFDKDMNTVETVKLDFIPEKTFNIDFVSYPDHFYMIYQYQKGSIVHCMGVKMDANAQRLSEPVELDTTRISVFTDNKIYSTIFSEDHQRIMIFKVQTRNQKFNLQTLLLDSDMKPITRKQYVVDYNEKKESYDNFLLANDGNFVFTHAKQSGNWDNASALALVMKAPQQDTFSYRPMDLKEKYVDQVKLKIDNRNGRYIINTYYLKKSRANIEGLYTCLWDRANDKAIASTLTEFYDSLRDEAKTTGMLRFAFDNFFIRQVIVKADGGFILTAEDYSSDSRGNNNFNRYNYLYNPYSFSSGNYYYYNPYNNFYRPYNNLNTQQSVRYYYDNIVVMSFNKTGQEQWTKVIHKSQFDDNDENFLSFSTMTSGSEIHFLFNDDRKFQIVSDQSFSPDGTNKRYPTLRSQQKGYEFMPSLSKQTGASQIIIPCAYRANLCFAKIDF